jgi:hypothetical protein
MEIEFSNPSFNRHMPYLIGGTKLLFCRASAESVKLEDQGYRQFRDMGTETFYRDYSIYSCDINLNTGVATNEQNIFQDDLKNVYCSPSAFVDSENKINLIYTREDLVSHRKPIYRAYRRKGEDLETLGEPEFIPQIFGLRSYCVAENITYKVVASSYIGNAYLMVENKQTKVVRKIALGLCGFSRRVSFVHGTNKILITYPSNIGKQQTTDCHFTDELNLDTLEVKAIIADQKSIYKCSIFEDMIIYVKKNSNTEDYSARLCLSEFTYRAGRIRPVVQIELNLG